MSKYPISKEFFPFSCFTLPISKPFLFLAEKGMRTPGFLFRDKQLAVTRHQITTRDEQTIEAFLLCPKTLCDPAPCLVYYHGGGFVLKAAGSHYRLAMEYAKNAGCKVLFVNYRLCPKYPFPVPQQDCFDAYLWLCENAEKLGIDKKRIGVGGDSAGGLLAVSTALFARDSELSVQPIMQMLVYPYLDGRNASESAKKYVDTPMWNSSKSKLIAPLTNPGEKVTDRRLVSPVEADLKNLPCAYVETAEFDCLHDDGVLYCDRLRELGIEAELLETKNTMHGFDIMLKAPITKAAVKSRIDFLKRKFHP